MTIKEIFKNLQTKGLNETLIEDGLICLDKQVFEGLESDTDGTIVSYINIELIKKDNDLSDLTELVFLPNEKKINLKEKEYILEDLNDLFYVNSDWDTGEEKGMIYLKLVNDILISKKSNKIAFLTWDSLNDPEFGVCISSIDYFNKIKEFSKYVDNLRYDNPEEAIKLIIEGDRRDFEFLTNYQGNNVQFGPTVLLEE